MAENQRSLPCALEAEQSVLGSILIDPNCFADLTEIIRGEDFYLEEHGEIFYAPLPRSESERCSTCRRI